MTEIEELMKQQSEDWFKERVISLATAKRFLTEHRKNHSGSFFSVVFQKRTDGSIREMVCRFNVKKHLKGGELAFELKEKQLSVVWSRDANGYRMINLPGLIKLRMKGKEYWIQENLKLLNSPVTESSQQ